uniref:Uncharacterized protein n=1 Tax=Hyaloperonospora arabidopsidis (strain Emoy2) TaxID=559515 RepID=M4B8R0_HYAAE
MSQIIGKYKVAQIKPPPCRKAAEGFRRGRAALPANCGRCRHRKDVSASLYRHPQPNSLPAHTL